VVRLPGVGSSVVGSSVVRLPGVGSSVVGSSVVGSPRSSPARVPGASVVLVGGEPALYLERGGRGLRVLLSDPEDARVQLALEALSEHARAGRLAARIALERVDGEPVLGSRWEPALERAGFSVGPRRAELGAR
jgi:ATP-dependent helicase Lhr and Lhr-like helicase